jgi:hypothetical protein
MVFLLRVQLIKASQLSKVGLSTLSSPFFAARYILLATVY